MQIKLDNMHAQSLAQSQGLGEYSVSVTCLDQVLNKSSLWDLKDYLGESGFSSAAFVPWCFSNSDS